MLSLGKIQFNSNFFDNLGHLTRLYLHLSDLSSTPSNVFDHLVNLELLSLSDLTGCSHIKITNLPRLKTLELIVDDGEMPALQNVNTGLEELHFSNNRSTGSPIKSSTDIIREFCFFPNLRVFRIVGSNEEFDLECLSEKFQSKENSTSERTNLKLKSLHLRNLKSLKGSFSMFPNLETLKMDELDAGVFQTRMFKGLTHLKSLEIDKMSADTPGVFEGLENLETLKLAIPTISKELFRGLYNLTELEIYDVTHFKKGAFNYLCQLETLDLYLLLDKPIPDELFKPLTKLRKLFFFSSNEYNLEITRHTLKGLKNLRLLGLSYNFKDVDINAFSSLFSLQMVCVASKEFKERLERKFPKIKIQCIGRRNHC